MKSFPVSNGSWNFHALFSCHSCLNLAGKHYHGLTFSECQRQNITIIESQGQCIFSPWEELLEKTVANKKSKNQDQLSKSLPPPVNCAPNNNDWLANLSHVPPNVSDSTERHLSKTLRQRWLTPFCIILTRTSSLQIHVSHRLPSFMILNVGLSPASVTNCSSVIATWKGRIESNKYRWVSEPALYATQWALRRFCITPLHLRISHAVLICMSMFFV